jgi:hypothetical protein
VGEWRTDPTFAMRRVLTDGADLQSFVGGPFDVRVVVAALRPKAKDGFLLGEVPWENFPKGDHVREAIHLLHTSGSPVRTATGVVSGMCANDMRAAAALAVPFLIRIATDPRHPYRADALAEVSSPAAPATSASPPAANCCSTAPNPSTTTSTAATASR